jgi:hypothetical protein
LANPFDLTDLHSMETRVKHTAVVNTAEGVFLVMKAAKALKERTSEEALTLWHQAVQSFEKALVSQPNNKEALLNIALTWWKITQLNSDGGNGKGGANVSPIVTKADRYAMLTHTHTQPQTQ